MVSAKSGDGEWHSRARILGAVVRDSKLSRGCKIVTGRQPYSRLATREEGTCENGDVKHTIRRHNRHQLLHYRELCIATTKRLGLCVEWMSVGRCSEKVRAASARADHSFVGCLD